MGAGETLSPAGLFKIAVAGRVVREKPLELREGFREWKVGCLSAWHTIYP
jgi:hypothetical protein